MNTKYQPQRLAWRLSSQLKKRNTIPAVGVVLSILVVLGGCGGPSERGSATPTVTVTATISPTPGMSVQQVASKVAGLRAKNQKLVEDFEQMCDLTKWDDSLVEAQAVACSLVVQRAPLEGQVAAKTLTIADPPAELSELLATTRASASSLGKVSSKRCESAPNSDDCIMVERFKASQAAESFHLAFAVWEPYL
ncbi:hypothetical protein HPO96_28650 [Kribbella sandramycini]|uniref:Uncharacterized protein n=1 Tax=Kribbella sandramycini TaxID=60450 RepID=A0A7Y4P3J7_9ACTN|nr:hypothetical protein [Kribbella sandramycini]MBB6571578.1 hypothetical protein [Kribbella sandramycini]NOL44224.1 hypothetical protein [Kribbella sandramycini]